MNDRFLINWIENGERYTEIMGRDEALELVWFTPSVTVLTATLVDDCDGEYVPTCDDWAAMDADYAEMAVA
jgi:hypothetical protein